MGDSLESLREPGVMELEAVRLKVGYGPAEVARERRNRRSLELAQAALQREIDARRKWLTGR